MAVREQFSTIPVVEFGRAREPRVPFVVHNERARQIADICHEVGFFVVTDHGVPAEVITGAFGASRAFFAMPEVDKLSIDKRKSPHFRGWEPVGAESTNNRPDLREQIDLWTDHQPHGGKGAPYFHLLGPNQWPAEELVPGFRPAIETWFSEVGALANDLMRTLAVGLGLAPEYFEGMFGDTRMSLTKLIHYPKTPPSGFGVNGHHDTGFLTVLASDGTAGLQVQNPDGRWIPVPDIPGGLVVNLGEMLQAMTGNYFVATPHRVVAENERYSMGYFHGPSLDVPLHRLPLDPSFAAAVAASERHQNAGFMTAPEATDAGVEDMQGSLYATCYGEQLWNYFARSYPENMTAHYPELART